MASATATTLEGGLVRAAGIIVYRSLQPHAEPQFLMLQTSYGKHHWTPPKGHVDAGEDDRATAIRETAEECGLTPDHYTINDNFPPIRLEYKVRDREKADAWRPKLVTYFLAKLTSNREQIKLSDEHQNFKWLEVKEACDVAGHADMTSALSTAHQFIAKSA